MERGAHLEREGRSVIRMPWWACIMAILSLAIMGKVPRRFLITWYETRAMGRGGDAAPALLPSRRGITRPEPVLNVAMGGRPLKAAV